MHFIVEQEGAGREAERTSRRRARRSDPVTLDGSIGINTKALAAGRIRADVCDRAKRYVAQLRDSDIVALGVQR